MAEEVLYLHDIHIAVEEQRGGGRPERMGRIDAAPDGRAVGELLLFHGAGELFQVVLQE